MQSFDGVVLEELELWPKAEEWFLLQLDAAKCANPGSIYPCILKRAATEIVPAFLGLFNQPMAVN